MPGLFDFLSMMDNYDEHVVARHETDTLIVDTAEVSDSPRPFETAVSHDQYNKGKWVIVECYDDKQSAQAGHDRWVQTMSAAELPESLVDRASDTAAQWCDKVDGSDNWRAYPRETCHEV